MCIRDSSRSVVWAARSLCRVCKQLETDFKTTLFVIRQPLELHGELSMQYASPKNKARKQVGKSELAKRAPLVRVNRRAF